MDVHSSRLSKSCHNAEGMLSYLGLVVHCEPLVVSCNPIKYKNEFLYEQRKQSKEKYGPDCTVSNTKFSSVTLNELATKARERIL